MTPTPAPSAQDAAASEGPSLAEIDALLDHDLIAALEQLSLAASDGGDLRELDHAAYEKLLGAIESLCRLRALLTAATERAEADGGDARTLRGFIATHGMTPSMMHSQAEHWRTRAEQAEAALARKDAEAAGLRKALRASKALIRLVEEVPGDG